MLANIQYGQRVFQNLSRLRCPTVAAIHGFCMGGGTEMALACRYRVATRDPSTKIGLPEVMLGIHPGWGGTARLPRLIGAPEALQLMLTGKAVGAEQAKSLGIVDKLTAPELLVETAKELIRHPSQRPFVQRSESAGRRTSGRCARSSRRSCASRRRRKRARINIPRRSR